MRYRTLEDLKNVSEVRWTKIPAIADLDTPLVMGSRRRWAANTRSTEVSWDLRREGTVEDEDAPLPPEELALSSSLFQQIQLRFSADEDTEDTVVGRLKYQLNKHRIRSDNIPKTKARRKTAEARIKRTNLVMNRAGRARRTRAGAARDHYIRSLSYELWNYSLGMARASDDGFQDRPLQTSPSQPRPMGCRHMTMCRFLWLLQ